MDFSRDFLLLIKELFTEIYVFYKWFKMKIMTLRIGLVLTRDQWNLVTTRDPKKASVVTLKDFAYNGFEGSLVISAPYLG